MTGLEWIFIIMAVFGAGTVLRRPRHRDHRHPGPPLPVKPSRAVRSAAATASDRTGGRLPVEYQVKVETIRRKVDWMLSRYGDRFPPGSKERHLIESTAAVYLPETLDAYYKLPPGYSRWPIRADGKTGLEVLWEQLDLLDRGLEKIARDSEQRDVEALLVNGRFLEQRFDSEPAARRD